jgi:2-dehydro-3-deoxyphosphogluconate aldolase/(4S)-4-hydroxy-2-oxoglutarate aldolase
VIAVLRTDSPQTALSLGRGFALTTLAGIEVTMTVPDAVKVIAALVAEGVPRVGAGTVRTLAEVDACAEAGASFIVSPHVDPALVQRCVQLDVPACPGVMTPSEIVRAMDLGAAAVKLFPVSAIGGHVTVRTLLEPLPDARIVVSGEVTLPEAPAYFAAGAWGVCIGRSLWPPEADLHEESAVRDYAQQALDASGCTAVIGAMAGTDRAGTDRAGPERTGPERTGPGSRPGARC